VINITISRIITEYRAEILIDEEGNQYIAPFPQGVTQPIQYGASIKAKATYLLTYQLIPYERIREQFNNEYNIPISTGSICNFNTEASRLLSELGFIKIVKRKLIQSAIMNADETGLNVAGKKIGSSVFSVVLSKNQSAPYKARSLLSAAYLTPDPARPREIRKNQKIGLHSASNDLWTWLEPISLYTNSLIFKTLEQLFHEKYFFLSDSDS